MIVAFDALKLVTVPDAERRLAMFALAIVVVARAEVPVTANVPVVVLLTEVKSSITPVRA